MHDVADPCMSLYLTPCASSCRLLPISRKRARGGRYCLVCSLVARSAAHGNNHHVQGANSNTASVGSNSFLHGRQPLGYLPPGTASRRGSASSVCGLRESAARAVGLQGPVAISRLKRAEWRQPGAASAVGADSAGGLGMVNLGRKQAKDGVFYRPLPKARSGSWGGEGVAMVRAECTLFS